MKKLLLAFAFLALLSANSFAQPRIEWSYFNLYEGIPETCTDDTASFEFYGSFRAYQLSTEFKNYETDLTIVGNLPTQTFNFNRYYNGGITLNGEIQFPDSGTYELRAIAVFYFDDSTSYTDTSDVITLSYGSNQCKLLNGYMFIDKNNNCNYDSGDSSLANQRVLIGERSGEILMTDNNGYFETLIPKFETGFGVIDANRFIVNQDSTGFHSLVCMDSISLDSILIGYQDSLTKGIGKDLFGFYLDWDPLEFCADGDSSIISFRTHQINSELINIPSTIDFGDGSSDYFEFNFIDEFYDVLHTYDNTGLYFPRQTLQTIDTTVINYFEPVLIPDSCGSVSGKVYKDENTNCVFDSTETLLSEVLVVAEWLGKTYFSKTNKNGNYGFNIPYGVSYTLRLARTNETGTIVSGKLKDNQACPALVSDSSVFNDWNFGITCGDVIDLAIVGFPPVTRPGFENTHYIKAVNSSCSGISNGILSYQLDTLETFISASLPQDSISNNKVYWTISNLEFLTDESISLKVKLDSTAELGSVICREVAFFPIGAVDSDSSNSVVNVCNTVRGSYDPNDKTCFINGTADTTNQFNKGDYFTYRIRFQNSGTDTAFNVYLLDTISELLNMETFEVIGSSHEMQYFFNKDRTIRFVFPDIKLPHEAQDEPNSHGYVYYRIMPDSGVVLNDEITNTAHIFFDYNEAIVTNTTLQQLRDNTVAVEEITLPKAVLFLYPNPAGESITLNLNNSQGNIQVQLFDLTGRKVLDTEMKNNASLDVSNIRNGVYVVKVSDQFYSTSKRVVIQR